MNELNFFIPGRARPKGSPRVITRSASGKYLDRPKVITDTPKSSRWQKATMAMAHRNISDEWNNESYYEVVLDFRFSRPGHHGVDDHPYPGHSFGDVDKLIRSTMDGIEASGAISDDTRVAWVLGSKSWTEDGGNEGCSVRITDLLTGGHFG